MTTPRGREHINSIARPTEARCEIIDTSTREVWQAVEPTPREWWDAPAPGLPKGWGLRDISIEREWIVDLPAPAETWWFEGTISYQGPIDLR